MLWTGLCKINVATLFFPMKIYMEYSKVHITFLMYFSFTQDYTIKNVSQNGANILKACEI